MGNREPIRRPSVVVHAERCKGCGRCVVVCPRQVLEMSEALNSHGYNVARVVSDECVGCGLCYYNCPEPEAITVYKKSREASAAKASDDQA